MNNTRSHFVNKTVMPLEDRPELVDAATALIAECNVKIGRLTGEGWEVRLAAGLGKELDDRGLEQMDGQGMNVIG